MDEKRSFAPRIAALLLLAALTLAALVAVPTPVAADGTDTHFLVLTDAACDIVGTGGNARRIDNDPGCWSHTSGGAGEAGVPGTGNDVIIDTSSGNAVITVGQLQGPMTVKSWTQGGTADQETIGVLSTTLTVVDDFVLSPGASLTWAGPIEVGGDVTLGNQPGVNAGAEFIALAPGGTWTKTGVWQFPKWTINVGATATMGSDIQTEGLVLNGVLTSTLVTQVLEVGLFACANPFTVGPSGDTDVAPTLSVISFSCDTRILESPPSGWQSMTIIGCDTVCDGTPGATLEVSMPDGLVVQDDLSVAVADPVNGNDCGSIALDLTGHVLQVPGTLTVGTAEDASDCFGVGFGPFNGDITSDRNCVGTYVNIAGTVIPEPESYPCAVLEGGGPAPIPQQSLFGPGGVLYPPTLAIVAMVAGAVLFVIGWFARVRWMRFWGAVLFVIGLLAFLFVAGYL